MTSKTIIFSTPMVQAITQGIKTETRRVAGFDKLNIVRQPYQVGDELWVRETWRGGDDTLECIFYKADESLPSTPVWQNVNVKWKPSIFMPRRFSRIKLIVKEVKLERLQSITKKGAKAEGFKTREEFFDFWNKINAKRGYRWQMNPWVWGIKFEVQG